MLSSRLFYILMANIVVLGANIWLVMGNGQAPKEAEREESITVSTPLHDVQLTNSDQMVDLESSESPRIQDSPLDFTPIEHFDIGPQLKALQELAVKEEQQRQDRINSKAVARKKQAEIDYLITENQRLSDKVSTLSNQINLHSSYVADSEEREKKLNESLALAHSQHALLLNSPISRIKASIDLQPDLLKNTVKKAGDSDVEQTKLEDVLIDTEVEGHQIETDIVDTNEAPVVQKERFSGAVEFGFQYEQDNQVTRNVLGRLILDYDEVDQYNINSDLDFEFESEDDEKSTEKFRWQLQADYNLDPTNLVFARSDIQRSQFASYEREDTFTVGYGRVFFNENNHKLNTEIGPGYKFAVPNIEEEAVSIDEFILRTRLNYERIISENLQVSLEGVVEFGDENSVFTSEFRVQNRIYQELYLIFDVNYKYNQNVPVDTVHREVSTGFNLMYAF